MNVIDDPIYNTQLPFSIIPISISKVVDRERGYNRWGDHIFSKDQGVMSVNMKMWLMYLLPLLTHIPIEIASIDKLVQLHYITIQSVTC